IFVAQDLAEIVLDSIILHITISFGIFLIRIVKNEIAQREQLEKLTRKLIELDPQKDEYVYVAVHELRAPMTAIKGYISLVLEGDTGKIEDQTREYLTDAFESNDRLIRLVNNMLNVSRIEEGRLVFQMGLVSLQKVVADVHSEYKH